MSDDESYYTADENVDDDFVPDGFFKTFAADGTVWLLPCDFVDLSKMDTVCDHRDRRVDERVCHVCDHDSSNNFSEDNVKIVPIR